VGEEHWKIFWHKNGEIKEWCKLHNTELGDLLSSQIIGWVVTSRSAWSAGHATSMWEKTNAYRDLVGKH